MSEIWHDQLKHLEKRLGYCFKNPRLLEIAMTHSSYVNESEQTEVHNERLEFLGDSVVGLFFSNELFNRYLSCREGELTHMRAGLVSGTALAERALEIGLDGYLRLGKGEEFQGGRKRRTLLANAFEALIGAVFLDGGFEAAKKVLEEISENVWEGITYNSRSKDNKSLLQELIQQRFKTRPEYNLLGTCGPEHKKRFDVAVTLPDGKILTASGATLKQAEQIAAGKALELFD